MRTDSQREEFEMYIAVTKSTAASRLAKELVPWTKHHASGIHFLFQKCFYLSYFFLKKNV